MRRLFLPFVVVFLVIGQLTMLKVRGQGNSSGGPNIVLILADDLGYGDLGAYGATKIETPVIDRLALEGMKFTHAQVVSSLCSPSRYSVMTGRYSWRSRLKYGVLKYFEPPLIEKQETTLASMLKEKGYYTACVGKWHLGLEWTVNDKAPANPEETVFNSWDEHAWEYIDFSRPVKGGPLDRGFDYFYGMAGSNNMQPYVLIENDRVTEPPSVSQLPYDHYVPADRAPNWHINRINQDLTEKAVEVIDRHFSTDADHPLFLYFPTSAIHRPCLPTFTRGKSEAGLRGDIVEELDWTVEQLINALKRNGVYDNTLLIFTSDNGPRPGDPAIWMEKYAQGDYEDFHQDYFDNYQPEYVNEQGNEIWKGGWFTYGHNASGNLLGFKSDAWQGGLQVPFIVRWPGRVPEGTVNDHYICLTDLMATLAEITGIALDGKAGEDSYSFMKNLKDEGAPQVRSSLTLTGGASGAFAVIKDDWKYIEPAPHGRWPETYYPDGPSNYEPQLYHLSEDPTEQNNLYDSLPDKVRELKELITRVQETPGVETKNIQ